MEYRRNIIDDRLIERVALEQDRIRLLRIIGRNILLMLGFYLAGARDGVLRRRREEMK